MTARPSERPKVHLTFPPPEPVRPMLAEQPWEVTWAADPAGQPRAELLRDVGGCAGVVTLLSDRVDDELLRAAGPALRVVANNAVGYDNIDVECARRRGVVATNTPGVLDEATADLAFALILAASRRVVEADAFVRSGTSWSWRTDLFVGLDVSAGATLGIVGLGRIGMAVARRAEAFDMRVVATPSRSNSDEADRRGIDRLPLDDVLGVSDVVSLHCPLTPETHHLIGARELRLVGPDGVLEHRPRADRRRGGPGTSPRGRRPRRCRPRRLRTRAPSHAGTALDAERRPAPPHRERRPANPGTHGRARDRERPGGARGRRSSVTRHLSPRGYCGCAPIRSVGLGPAPAFEES